VNNIFAYAVDILEIINNQATREDWLRISNNIIYDSENDTTLSDEELLFTGVSVESPDINTNPMFLNLYPNFYRLASGSPAIDSGVQPEPYAYTSDSLSDLTPGADELIIAIDGNGDGIAEFDIGAVEFSLP